MGIRRPRPKGGHTAEVAVLLSGGEGVPRAPASGYPSSRLPLTSVPEALAARDQMAHHGDTRPSTRGRDSIPTVSATDGGAAAPNHVVRVRTLLPTTGSSVPRADWTPGGRCGLGREPPRRCRRPARPDPVQFAERQSPTPCLRRGRFNRAADQVRMRRPRPRTGATGHAASLSGSVMTTAFGRSAPPDATVRSGPGRCRLAVAATTA